MTTPSLFKGRHFEPSLILLCVRWYLSYPLSYRNMQEMMAERGLRVDATTIYRWVQAYAPEMNRRIRRHLRPTSDRWHVDETYIEVKGRWTYLYRAVDDQGQTVDFLLSAKRDMMAALRFFQRALRSPHNGVPKALVVDRAPSYPSALIQLRREGHLGSAVQLITGRGLNNRIEQDHRRIKRLVRYGLGFKTFDSARRTIEGYEALAMIRKGQVAVDQASGWSAAAFIEGIFGVVA